MGGAARHGGSSGAAWTRFWTAWVGVEAGTGSGKWAGGEWNAETGRAGLAPTGARTGRERDVKPKTWRFRFGGAGNGNA